MHPKSNTIPFIYRAIALCMALYLFNFSIDSQDAQSDSVAEDLSFNDIESVYEFVTEAVFGIENAVEEHEERDPDDGGSFEFKKFYFTSLISSVQIKTLDYIFELQLPEHDCPALAIRFAEIDSPPPRA
jgi:hypothetical protein